MVCVLREEQIAFAYIFKQEGVETNIAETRS
jgi:hypothetical protein